MLTLGEKIAEIRKQQKMTQEEFASKLSVSAQTVSKWENNINMPDIMLLPSLAKVFDVSIDDLFSIGGENKNLEHIRQYKIPDMAHHALLHVMDRALSPSDIITPESIEDYISLIQNDTSFFHQSGIVAHDKEYKNVIGSAYATASIGIVYRKNDKEASKLLDNEKCADFLALLSKKSTRLLLKHLIENPKTIFTHISLAKKCQLSEEEAANVLNDLAKYKLVSIQQIDTGNEENLNVYAIMAQHKLMLAIYPLLEIATLLSVWTENWSGLIS